MGPHCIPACHNSEFVHTRRGLLALLYLPKVRRCLWAAPPLDANGWPISTGLESSARRVISSILMYWKSGRFGNKNVNETYFGKFAENEPTASVQSLKLHGTEYVP